MGGQPTDDPRDLNSGSATLKEDDRGSGTGPVPGASGSPAGNQAGASVSETVGVRGDRAVDDAGKARGRE